jgi:cell division protein FtsW
MNEAGIGRAGNERRGKQTRYGRGYGADPLERTGSVKRRKRKSEERIKRINGERMKRKSQAARAGVKEAADFPLFIIVFVLVVVGVVMVSSAGYYDTMSQMDDPYYYLKRVVTWSGLSFAVMLTTALLPYRVYFKLAPAIMTVSFLLLALVFTPLGEMRNDAVRWLNFGPVTVMPGELAKGAAIIFTAWFLSKDPERIRSFTKGVAPMLLLCAAYFFLIWKQPNLSTAVTVCGVIIGVMFVAGLKWKHLGLLCAAGAAGVFALILMDEDGYQLKRLTSFWDPLADQKYNGYQVTQALLAIGAGGPFGVGLGKSIQKALYLPEAQTDFILAVIGEETGLLGCVLLLCAYLFLIWKGIDIAIRAEDMFGRLLAAGITVMIALQVILNVAVVTSVMPPTGVTLPFISYGGNSLLLFMAGAGILLNISRKKKAEAR